MHTVAYRFRDSMDSAALAATRAAFIVNATLEIQRDGYDIVNVGTCGDTVAIMYQEKSGAPEWVSDLKTIGVL